MAVSSFTASLAACFPAAAIFAFAVFFFAIRFLKQTNKQTNKQFFFFVIHVSNVFAFHLARFLENNF